jgi:hypothetical protein
MAMARNDSNKRARGRRVPQPFCPNCKMIKNDWPGEGYTLGGENYCCQGCAEGTGCTCQKVPARGFSREGQVATRSAPRRGKQRSGAPAPQGELSGERDSQFTEEAIDQSGDSGIGREIAPRHD